MHKRKIGSVRLKSPGGMVVVVRRSNGCHVLLAAVFLAASLLTISILDHDVAPVAIVAGSSVLETATVVIEKFAGLFAADLSALGCSVKSRVLIRNGSLFGWRWRQLFLASNELAQVSFAIGCRRVATFSEILSSWASQNN